jgi:hypothetical protein
MQLENSLKLHQLLNTARTVLLKKAKGKARGPKGAYWTLGDQGCQCKEDY